jgi:uncharacterized membrane protein YphA (DoxX/SURF4 family)
MGVVKALDPVDFLKLLHEYHLLGSPQPLNTVAALLPWLEIFCGLLLVAGIAVRGAALTIAAMFATFTAAILHRALTMHAGLDLPFCAIRFDCGCGSGEVLVCAKVIENIAWFALASWLVSSRHAPRRLVAWR